MRSALVWEDLSSHQNVINGPGSEKISGVNSFSIGLHNPYYKEKNVTHYTFWRSFTGQVSLTIMGAGFLWMRLQSLYSAMLKVVENIYWAPYMKCGGRGGSKDEGRKCWGGRGSRWGYQGGLVIKKATREASCSGGKLWIKEARFPATSIPPSVTHLCWDVWKSKPVSSLAFIWVTVTGWNSESWPASAARRSVLDVDTGTKMKAHDSSANGVIPASL